MYVIRCLSVPGGVMIDTGIDAVGRYLAAYDPEYAEGYGTASWTDDPSQAMSFVSLAAARDCYQAVPFNRPLRPDGQPNRPLTAASVEIIRYP